MKPLPNFIEERIKINFNQLSEMNKREESHIEHSNDFGSLWSDEEEGFISDAPRANMSHKYE